MATLNLGRIKPVFRGAYSGGTAYVVDDIVTSGDETFICILASTGNATSNATYWTKLAAKGTDGTDVGTTITTQGDILYRDGSGLQRLAKPASDKFLKNTSGGVLSWDDAGGGKLGQIVSTIKTDATSVNATSFTDVSGMSIAITPSATSSKILLMGSFVIINHSQYAFGRIVRDIGGGGYSAPTGFVGDSEGSRIQSTIGNLYHEPDGNKSASHSTMLLDTPNTTSACTYKLQFRQSAGSYTTYLNRSHTDTNGVEGFRSVSSLIAIEITA